MDTYKQSQQKTSKIDDFLDALELAEPADDVPVSEIELSEAANPRIPRWTRLRKVSRGIKSRIRLAVGQQNM